MKTDSGYQFAGIIPARFASSRFPGKPLIMIGDKPMIRHVYEQASKALDIVFVATDDTRIHDTVLAFGGRSVMTSPEHKSGTDRCAEALGLIENQTGIAVDVVVNIQGDEPFIKPAQIDLLASCFSDQSVEIATLVRRSGPDTDIFNPNLTKAILDKNGNAIYFSRAAIPYVREKKMEEWARVHTYYEHVGIYAYKAETLKAITLLPRSPLEIAESLEQNRWIENGLKIRTAITEWESICIDTPDDLEKARIFFKHFE
jgi:3-deoxy-manno-octulosonate cytidylyltransferase (CMP-KDO synthetase)